MYVQRQQTMETNLLVCCHAACVYKHRSSPLNIIEPFAVVCCCRCRHSDQWYCSYVLHVPNAYHHSVFRLQIQHTTYNCIQIHAFESITLSLLKRRVAEFQSHQRLQLLIRRYDREPNAAVGETMTATFRRHSLRYTSGHNLWVIQ